MFGCVCTAKFALQVVVAMHRSFVSSVNEVNAGASRHLTLRCKAM